MLPDSNAWTTAKSEHDGICRCSPIQPPKWGADPNYLALRFLQILRRIGWTYWVDTLVGRIGWTHWVDWVDSLGGRIVWMDWVDALGGLVDPKRMVGPKFLI